MVPVVKAVKYELQGFSAHAQVTEQTACNLFLK